MSYTVGIINLNKHFSFGAFPRDAKALAEEHHPIPQAFIFTHYCLFNG